MVICLERDADLHMAQLMPLPLTVSCFSKIQIGFPFLAPAHPGSPGQRAVKRTCVCVINIDTQIHRVGEPAARSRRTSSRFSGLSRSTDTAAIAARLHVRRRRLPAQQTGRPPDRRRGIQVSRRLSEGRRPRRLRDRKVRVY